MHFPDPLGGVSRKRHRLPFWWLLPAWGSRFCSSLRTGTKSDLTSIGVGGGLSSPNCWITYIYIYTYIYIHMSFLFIYIYIYIYISIYIYLYIYILYIFISIYIYIYVYIYFTKASRQARLKLLLRTKWAKGVWGQSWRDGTSNCVNRWCSTSGTV